MHRTELLFWQYTSWVFMLAFPVMLFAGLAKTPDFKDPLFVFWFLATTFHLRVQMIKLAHRLRGGCE